MQTPKLLSPVEYIDEATKHIHQATRRIAFVSMMVTDDKRTENFIDALASAAKRGVKVEVAADFFTFGELGGHLQPLRYYSKSSKVTKDMAKKLLAAGANFTWVGRFSSSPFTGRNHMKCLVIDDTVFSFGGINMDADSLENVDYMFRVNDPQLAEELSDDISRIIKADSRHFSYRSHEFSFGKKSKVLVDGGLQGDSIIYRRACQLAKEAEDILFVSQYCPTSKISRILKEKNTRLYFNAPKRANTKLNHALISVNMLVSGNKSLYERKKYLHAKFMIFTMPGGKQIAITGSHNFTYIGTLFGTREIALETEDPKIIKQLERFFEKEVK